MQIFSISEEFLVHCVILYCLYQVVNAFMKSLFVLGPNETLKDSVLNLFGHISACCVS